MEASTRDACAEILRGTGEWDGPDWNRYGDGGDGEILTEPGRPSHLRGPLFPWPEGTHSRYIENAAGDGLLFDMEGPPLDPPRGEHNPDAQWIPDHDPAHQPASGVGFTLKAKSGRRPILGGVLAADPGRSAADRGDEGARGRSPS